MAACFKYDIADGFADSVESIQIGWFGQKQLKLVRLYRTQPNDYLIGTVERGGLCEDNRMGLRSRQHDRLWLVGQILDVSHFANDRR